MKFNLEEFKVQGIKFNYYFVCRRKLWLFNRGITMENNSERVMQGKTVHEDSYARLKTREVLIDDILRLDIMDKDFIREIKITSRMRDVDRMQLLYYLYYLKKLGIQKKGVLNYVKERKNETVELDKESELKIESTLIDINKLLSQENPPKIIKYPYCKKCAYYQFCFIQEVE
ncbi:CRISPR-associated protein Cas4 [Clostridium tyrobutyricum]|uniref:CRISPR-associated protein Cas4 n=1 Tax=Clostridium tyrobutyricum TaxID=1519 RepID=UPI001C381C3C|nr:CRISPR-associated protein Cas4 [Clostridium tyrobutyricum]MBR9648891.1 CRISPR-associated protein Cas4 [Clostridium tyrobutyricum]MBV4420550.1 CRISPR-associated protein Cas4 [Clostridium tyrobutyricum]